ncbi:hypothetical protein T10_13096 [Trichinella papuae]|uniref:Uncharacterized protein n=1 Tax=Trichinella papuae TaxID=268474 RepID=A0A0V1M3I1_9BILA|nr:hypothetical protein T10_13096 [Trichinella papuae]
MKLFHYNWNWKRSFVGIPLVVDLLVCSLMCRAKSHCKLFGTVALNCKDATTVGSISAALKCSNHAVSGYHFLLQNFSYLKY